MSDGKSLRFRRNALSRDRSSAADLIIHGSDRGKVLMGNVQEMANTEVDVKKTLTRLLVEKYLMKWKWYYPRRDDDDENKPNLKEGWAFYEHVTLARRKRRKEGDPNSAFKRAQPGEVGDTQLYGFFSTSDTDLSQWGVGLGLYFSTMRWFAMALFVGGLISVRNIIYFYDDDYNDKDTESRLGIFLKGSAVCNSATWLQCEEGYCDLGKISEAGVTYARPTNATDGTDLTFVQRLNCPYQDSNDNDILKAGLCNLATMCTLILITIAFSLFQSRQQKVYDEDQCTASDYSVRVLNPPKDAYDPEKWREFFKTFDEKGVTIVTIVLNNGALLKALRARRYFRKELLRRLPDIDLETISDDELSEKIEERSERKSKQCRPLGKMLFHCFLRPILRIFNLYLDPTVLVRKIKERTEVAEKLLKETYDVSSVIVTFETEKGQRCALESLKASKLDIKRQNTEGKQFLFGGVLLHVIRPSEPSSIRYLNADVALTKRIIQFSITLSITIGLIALSTFLVYNTRKSSGPFWAGILTTSLNIIIPFVVNLLLIIETHQTEDDRQRSLYIKVTLFRWVNTAIAAKFVVPFTSSLGTEKYDLIPAINGIIVAEIWIAPFLSLLDILGNISKHYYAPRATVKEQLFLCFTGTYYNLADKYTDMTKLVFVCYYYCSLNPNLLFFGAFALLVRYYSDKYCLLRIWSDVPNIGTQVAEFSRKYFLSFAVVAGTVVASYDWALFNFDRVCDGDTPFESGNYTVTIYNKNGTKSDEPDTIFVNSTHSNAVRVCTDEMCCQTVGLSFPAIPSRFQTEDFKWMSDGQAFISTCFGWFSVVVLAGFLLSVFGSTVYKFFKSLVIAHYDESKQGKDQNIDFSNLEKTDAYIPLIREPSLAFPLITCDIDEIPLNFLGFEIPQDEFMDDYNVIFDLQHDEMKRSSKMRASMLSMNGIEMIAQHSQYQFSTQEEKRPVFDIVKYWPYGGN